MYCCQCRQATAQDDYDDHRSDNIDDCGYDYNLVDYLASHYHYFDGRIDNDDHNDVDGRSSCALPWRT